MVNRVAYLFSTFEPPRGPQPLTAALNANIHDALHEFAEVSGMSVNQVVADALRRYFEHVYWPVEDSDQE